jgi:hypothetical protein
MCLILDIFHLDTLYLREQGCEDPLLFFEARRGPRAIKFWINRPRMYYIDDGLRNEYGALKELYR